MRRSAVRRRRSCATRGGSRRGARLQPMRLAICQNLAKFAAKGDPCPSLGGLSTAAPCPRGAPLPAKALCISDRAKRWTAHDSPGAERRAEPDQPGRLSVPVRSGSGAGPSPSDLSKGAVLGDRRGVRLMTRPGQRVWSRHIVTDQVGLSDLWAQPSPEGRRAYARPASHARVAALLPCERAGDTLLTLQGRLPSWLVQEISGLVHG